MRAPFFITGLPRSRTAWLANLFTWGDSFCYHDILPECGSLDEFHNKLRAVPNCLQVGLSDSSLLLIWRSMVRIYPTAQWVVIKRDPTECLESFIKYFREYPYIGMPPLDEGFVRDTFSIYQKELESLCDYLTERGYRFNLVSFLALNNYTVCNLAMRQAVNEYLSEERFNLLSNLRINTKSANRAITSDKFHQLLNECFLAGNGIDESRGTAIERGASSALPERHATELVHNESR